MYKGCRKDVERGCEGCKNGVGVMYGIGCRKGARKENDV